MSDVIYKANEETLALMHHPCNARISELEDEVATLREELTISEGRRVEWKRAAEVREKISNALVVERDALKAEIERLSATLTDTQSTAD